ncbi:MAG: EAL domain-containing protein [Pseudomonadota bacterium]
MPVRRRTFFSAYQVPAVSSLMAGAVTARGPWRYRQRSVSGHGLSRSHSRGQCTPGFVALKSLLVPMLMYVAMAAGFSQTSQALETINIPAEADVMELTTRGTLYDDRGDNLQVETAAGRDGMVGRMTVKARTAGTNPNWIVFALSNETDTVMERWLTSSRYTFVGSQVIWPDLDARRLEAVTPSIGFIPERIESDRADVFRLTLEPGQTVTFAVELVSDRFARVFLWKPLAYELKVRERQLFNGSLLGLTGLLAVFLTAIFAANHKAIFPTAALVAWCVLAYLCIDFGFFHKLFNLKPEDNAVYRAGAEAAVAASLVIFLYTFLRLGYSNGITRMLMSVWILAQLALIAVAVVDPRLSATFARLSFLMVGGAGVLMILFLALRGQDRALSLIPTWLLFLVWIFAAGVTLSGRLAGDVVVAGLVGGLVLIVILIGFTVTQFAFRSFEPIYGSDPNEQQIRSLAVDGAGAATWEWSARRDEIKVSPLVEAALGLNGGELSTKVDDFVTHIHPTDRERLKLLLWSVKERTHRRIKTDFQIRHADNTYRWFELEASAVETAEGRNLRCVGLLRDVTDTHQAQQRLLSDAVNCPLTGLPNRELFLDRLNVAIRRAQSESSLRPTVLYIDVDKFNAVNNALGLVVGDTLLLTLSRRLANQLGDNDTLARMNGDQFAVLLLDEREPRALAELAEELRRAMRAPIRIAGKEIVLTGSLGIAVYDGQEDHRDLVREAEIAMCRAKRSGADKVEIFRPEMRDAVDDRLQVETELKRALETGQIKVYYQPIIYLPTEELAGFEALVRWEHPKKGLLSPVMFVPIAEESELIHSLGSYVLNTSAKTAAIWHKELPRVERPLFVSVNVSSRQLLRQDLVQDVRHLLSRGVLEKGTLRLEITESLVMENPEAAVDLLKNLSAAGADIALDDFGTGYSSLAYLRRFPFDTIKIDRQFMADEGSDGDGSGPAIVRSVVALAHELGKTVVAEGIENPDEVGFLRSIGCEYAQGYYYGEPMSEAEVIQLLRIVKRSERNSDGTGLFRLKRKPKALLTDQSEGKTSEKEKAAAAGAAAPGATGRKPVESGVIEGTVAARSGNRAGTGAGASDGNGGRSAGLSGGPQPPRPSTRPPLPAASEGPFQRGVIDALPKSFVRPMARGAPVSTEQLLKSGLAGTTSLNRPSSSQAGDGRPPAASLGTGEPIPQSSQSQPRPPAGLPSGQPGTMPPVSTPPRAGQNQPPNGPQGGPPGPPPTSGSLAGTALPTISDLPPKLPTDRGADAAGGSPPDGRSGPPAVPNPSVPAQPPGSLPIPSLASRPAGSADLGLSHLSGDVGQAASNGGVAATDPRTGGQHSIGSPHPAHGNGATGFGQGNGHGNGSSSHNGAADGGGTFGGNGAGSAAPPDLSKLPPGIAASLAKLAGSTSTSQGRPAPPRAPGQPPVGRPKPREG